MPTRKMKESFTGTAVSRNDRLLYLLQQQQRSKNRDVTRLRASVSPVGDTEVNPLQQAVFRGCIECIRVLVETPPYHSVDRSCGPEGLRPIHIASREGHIHVLRYLASAGASVEKCDIHGNSGLHHAALGGQLRATRWLLRHGAQITLDKVGWTPIQVAKEHGYTEIVTLLTNHSSCGTLNLMPSTLSESPNSQRYSSSTSEPNNSITPSNTTTILIATNDHKDHKTKPQQKRANQNYRNDDCCGEGGEVKVTQIHQDSSSSGNSSLVTAITSSVSNSPSSLSSSTTICSCSCSSGSGSDKSDDNETNDCSTTSCSTVVKIGPTVSRICDQESDSNLIPLSFYLHPPPTPVTTSPRPRSIDQIIQEEGHMTVEPFYLHPPPILKDQTENRLNQLTQLVIPPNVTLSSEKSNSVHFEDTPLENFKMAPVTPVNSSSDYLPTKEKKDEEKSEGFPMPSASGSTVSPPPPPPPKTGRVQALRSAIVLDSPAPPPPPPPMPKFEHKGTPFRSPSFRSNAISTILNRLNSERTNAGTPCENDYEDIDEIHGGETYYEEAALVTANGSRAKLNRCLSAPPLQIGIHVTHSGGSSTPEPQSTLIQPKGVPPGMRRPFIPPNFPDPPKDALIKPSEYLKSIQQSQSKKLGKGQANGGGTLTSMRTSSNRIEEVIKLLNGTEMPMVPEESNVDEDMQELNLERRSNSAKGRSHFDEYTFGGGIKPEELMKVNLRKTTMSRTLSAPVIGRVLPDLNGNGSHDMSPLEGNHPILHNNYGKSTTNLTPSTRAAIIAELAESSQVGGVREWKEELRRRQLEEEKAAAKEIASIYSPLNFFAEDLSGQIPSTDLSGTPIPPWKRQMMAKKAAEKAKKEAEEQRKLDAEAKRELAIPPWKRQLMQRRDSDAKGAQ